MVVKNTVHYEDEFLKIKLDALPDYLPRYDDIKRLTEYKGYWLIIPVKENEYRVEFYYTTKQKPFLPRFIMDPILQKLLMESFDKLIQLSEAV